MAKTALTEEVVLARCKVDTVESVQKLNVWGAQIDDVRVLRKMPSLEVVSLSVNRIASLRDFQHCPKIKELYLRKNLISDLSEVRYLQGMTRLKVLWLLENPVAEQANYRLMMIKLLPTLEKLDNQTVTQEERVQAAALEDGQRQGSPSRREPQRPRTAENSRPQVPQERPPPEADRAPQRPGSSGSEKPVPRPRPDPRPSESRNENLIQAVLALLKELDDSTLELVRREVDKRLTER